MRESEIINDDLLKVLPNLGDNEAQIIIADPPYNIGKDFGNKSDKQPMDDYLKWCDEWIEGCLRVLKPNGTMFIYGFSEILALILSRIPHEINRRWIVWHYTNKTTPSLNFWQRTHESIIVLWKNEKIFNRDAVREPYTDTFVNNANLVKNVRQPSDVFHLVIKQPCIKHTRTGHYHEMLLKYQHWQGVLEKMSV